VTLSDLKRQDSRGRIFPSDICNYARAAWPRTTKFGRTTRAEGHVSTGQPRPTQRLQNFLEPLHMRTRYEKQQILHGDQRRWEDILRGRLRHLPWPTFLWHEGWRAISLRSLTLLYYLATRPDSLNSFNGKLSWPGELI